MPVLDWIRLHMQLECVGLDETGHLYRLTCPNPDTLARVYVTCHAEGISIFFRAGLDEALREKLRQLPIQAYYAEPEQVKAVLAVDGPCEDIHIGKSYLFPETLSPAAYPDVVRISQLEPALVQRYDAGLSGSDNEAFAVLADGQIVCTCESSRENEQAGEAWVRTLEAYRRRGFGRQAVAAWGQWLQQHGKVPFYSHKLENRASQALAESLGLILYITDAGYA